MQRKEIEEEEEEEEEDEGGFVSSHSSFGGMRPKVKTNSPTKHGQACGSPTLFMCECFFIKNGRSRPLFVHFGPFLITISIIQIEKSFDGVLGIRTHGHRMEDTDETIKVWRPP